MTPSADAPYGGLTLMSVNADWLFCIRGILFFCRAAFRPLIARSKRFSGLKAAVRTAEMAQPTGTGPETGFSSFSPCVRRERRTIHSATKQLIQNPAQVTAAASNWLGLP